MKKWSSYGTDPWSVTNNSAGCFPLTWRQPVFCFGTAILSVILKKYQFKYTGILFAEKLIIRHLAFRVL